MRDSGADWETVDNVVRRDKEEHAAPYGGMILVAAFDRERLDLTLWEVEESRREVLKQYRLGEEKKETACTGTGWLREALRLAKEEKSPEAKESQKYDNALRELEEKIQTDSKRCECLMEEYFEYPEAMDEEVLFVVSALEEQQICCGHLKRAFDTVILPELISAVTQMSAVRAFDLEHTRIVITGEPGYTCCMQAALREYFGSRMGAIDRRFLTLFLKKRNRLLAAEQKNAANVVFAYEIGVVLGGIDGTFRYQNCFIPLAKNGESVKHYRNPVYIKEHIVVMNTALKSCYLQLYLKTEEEERICFFLEKNAGECFPMEKKYMEYQLGLSMEEERVPCLCIRSESGNVRKIQIEEQLDRGIEAILEHQKKRGK